MPETPKSISHPAVLIVDDNADFCHVAADILRADGFTVDECCDAQLAIARVKSKSYNVIVVEPSPAAGFASLFDVLAASQETFSRVVVATTETDDNLVDRLNDAGVFRVLHKPLERQELSEVVRACSSAPKRPVE